MQEWIKRCEMNVKRQKVVKYTNTGCVKVLSSKNDLLTHACDYKYKEWCKVHG